MFFEAKTRISKTKPRFRLPAAYTRPHSLRRLVANNYPTRAASRLSPRELLPDVVQNFLGELAIPAFRNGTRKLIVGDLRVGYNGSKRRHRSSSGCVHFLIPNVLRIGYQFRLLRSYIRHWLHVVRESWRARSLLGWQFEVAETLTDITNGLSNVDSSDARMVAGWT